MRFQNQFYVTFILSYLFINFPAENIAKQYSIKREEQDKFAEECQKKTEEAQSKHLFDKEIVPVNYTVGKEVKTLTKDEFPKSGVTMETLAKLRPVFLKVRYHYKIYINT